MADTPASARPRGVLGATSSRESGQQESVAWWWVARRGGRVKPSGGGSTSGGPSGGSIKIGSVAPITGPYSGDGQEMVRGAEMAVAEINAAGGVAGRTLELVTADISDQAPENFIQAAQRLVSQEKVAAAFSGYTSTTSAEYKIYGDAGVPLLHTNTLQANTDFVVDNGITSIFQCCPTEIWYAQGFIQLMQEWIGSKAWTPRDQYRRHHLQQRFVQHLDRQRVLRRHQETRLERHLSTTRSPRPTPTGVHSWRASAPTRRTSSSSRDYLAGDLAGFATQFASAPTPSLLYQQYGPSVPEYLDLAKGAANGVLWSTTIGTLPDEIGNDFPVTAIRPSTTRLRA